ncbi:hypothetical protein PSU4_46140 [Pseudonocardia sulfidoxydans NBRC 16205]|uniref:Uncharacterized protein n=1 Tax=Pseudonocardia sulfidoxydans NBRC 16205 TaxID=1223511 RepID=A0A511DLG8_9PSEU|nr:hypothetical protein PSU4_46140 [Pseudonocardia sulfidoxydans NBRC 16205]
MDPSRVSRDCDSCAGGARYKPVGPNPFPAKAAWRNQTESSGNGEPTWVIYRKNFPRGTSMGALKSQPAPHVDYSRRSDCEAWAAPDLSRNA